MPILKSHKDIEIIMSECLSICPRYQGYFCGLVLNSMGILNSPNMGFILTDNLLSLIPRYQSFSHGILLNSMLVLYPSQ